MLINVSPYIQSIYVSIHHTVLHTYVNVSQDPRICIFSCLGSYIYIIINVRKATLEFQ